MVVIAWFWVLQFAVMAVAPDVVVLAIAAGAGALAGPPFNVVLGSVIYRVTPNELLGRVRSVSRLVAWGTIPLGMLLGGGLATWFGMRSVLWIGAVGQLFSIFPVAASSIRSVREMPEPVQEPTPAQAELAGGVLEPQPLAGPAAADA
jgi:hypothetical protein